MKTMKLESWAPPVAELYGPRWGVTGNAAECLEPAFSSGVTLALESASRAAKCIDRELAGGTVDWQKDYGAVIEKAVSVFKTFVRSWYANELPRILLQPNKTDLIKRSITAVLGGYVL